MRSKRNVFKFRKELENTYMIVLIGATRDIQKDLPKRILNIQRTQNL